MSVLFKIYKLIFLKSGKKLFYAKKQNVNTFINALLVSFFSTFYFLFYFNNYILCYISRWILLFKVNVELIHFSFVLF